MALRPGQCPRTQPSGHLPRGERRTPAHSRPCPGLLPQEAHPAPNTADALGLPGVLAAGPCRRPLPSTGPPSNRSSLPGGESGPETRSLQTHTRGELPASTGDSYGARSSILPDPAGPSLHGGGGAMPGRGVPAPPQHRPGAATLVTKVAAGTRGPVATK